ncbi:hypothetical protein J4G08_17315 [Candidatus Poribacteria bacterium]|nr:hypothetical protein [Candidatus Poribacteria bacterium]
MAKSRTTGEMVDGKKHGYWITYYANGIKRSEGNYIHGKKDGRWIQYHKNGNKATEACFSDDKLKEIIYPIMKMRTCKF